MPPLIVDVRLGVEPRRPKTFWTCSLLLNHLQTLQEGLTVYRDQEFSADMGSRARKRIEDVRILRAAQFPEDNGPMSHPIRPEKYAAIDNFYTATVYNKGAEVIRMYETLLGRDGFRKGMDLYFERHDGNAVTCDDFRSAMRPLKRSVMSVIVGWCWMMCRHVMQCIYWIWRYLKISMQHCVGCEWSRPLPIWAVVSASRDSHCDSYWCLGCRDWHLFLDPQADSPRYAWADGQVAHADSCAGSLAVEHYWTLLNVIEQIGEFGQHISIVFNLYRVRTCLNCVQI